VALADLDLETVDQVVVARLDGEIDMSNASELGTTISRQVPNDAMALVVELSDIDYLDSAGIQVLYELHERLDTRGQQLRLVVPDGAAITEALRLAGVQSVITTVPTLDAALQSLRA
jgi:anti-anti-sigma factor